MSTGYILKKTYFLARSMKTKAVFLGYPSKILLLKDLRDGRSFHLEFGKCMKTGSDSRYPSKISLLKDLGRVFWSVSEVLSRSKARTRVVKEPKVPSPLSNS